jgi:uncharacterized protein (DUF608 family)
MIIRQRTRSFLANAVVAVALLVGAENRPAYGDDSRGAATTCFPADLPGREWVQFDARGYSKPVWGVVYRKDDLVTNGMALGGIDTGCIDLETSGMLGYCTIFNSHVPRRGPLNVPILGISIGGQTWVLCDPKQVKQGWGDYQVGKPSAHTGVKPELSRVVPDKNLHTVKEIRYWGHYPVADLEFETDAPVSVGLRAWSPFLPGRVNESMVPAIMFEVDLRNTTASKQDGTVAFSFPGPTSGEAGTSYFTRKYVEGRLYGQIIEGTLCSYLLAADEPVRQGGELFAWGSIATAMPIVTPTQAGASVAVDFSLRPGQRKTIRFVLAWHAPTWSNLGRNDAVTMPPNYSGEPRTFAHMYAKRYPSAIDAANYVIENRASLFKRIAAWQQVIYTEEKLPGWLRDALVNVLYMMSEDSYWAQKRPPLPDWVREEDGLFGMNECPRGCPQIECIPCSFYGSLPIAYFFPELELATLRGYKGYQFDDGAPTWIFGGCTGSTPYLDFACPTKGYQFATNGISLATLVDQFVLCHDTKDKEYLREFYPMIKKCMEWTVKLRTTSEYSMGERIISMPDGNVGTEWFEAPEPGWAGMTAHVGGLHLAQLRITERMAREAGDVEFAKQCGEWIAATQEAMEKRLWTGSYYLNYLEPESNRKSEFVFGYQLDGEWITDHHGLAGTVPNDRVVTTLDTITRCNVAVTKYGAVNYANPDGTPAVVKGYGTYSYFPPEALMLAMTYMYNGQEEFGVELARKVWHNLFCLQGYTWDMPNIMRGDVDTGERTFGNDYYQDMMLWSLPAAIEGKDLGAVAKGGGLVARVVRAAK